MPEDENQKEKHRILGGTKAGNGAWALAWVDTIMEPPARDMDDEHAKARQRLLQTTSSDSPADELGILSRQLHMVS